MYYVLLVSFRCLKSIIHKLLPSCSKTGTVLKKLLSFESQLQDSRVIQRKKITRRNINIENHAKE